MQYVTNHLPSVYWWVRKDWQKKELGVPLFFPFHLCHHFRSKLLANTVIQLRICRGSWLFLFLRTTLLIFCAQSKFQFRWKVWPLKIVSLPTYQSWWWHTSCVPSLSPSDQALWLHHSLAPGTLLRLCKEPACSMVPYGSNNHVLYVFPLPMSMFHCLTRLQVQNTISKIKLLRTSGEQQQSIQQSRARCKHCADAQVTCPWSPPWYPFQTTSLPQYELGNSVPRYLLCFIPFLKPGSISFGNISLAYEPRPNKEWSSLHVWA